MHMEKLLLTGLKRNGPKAYLNAFSTLPKTMRLMYVHSYQSFVWNQMASERIELFGYDRPVVGDLVAVDEVITEDETDLPENEKSAQDDLINLDEVLVAEEDVAEDKLAYKVKVVTEEDVRANTYHIDQVILPLAGHSVQYPTHKIGDRYREVLRGDGLDPDNLHHKHQEYNLPGSYRKLIVKPRNLEHEVLRYDDYQQPLAQTDLDILTGRPPSASCPSGKYKALVIRFELPSSCYATMCFRELFKTPTHIIFQKSLSEGFLNESTTSSAASLPSNSSSTTPTTSAEEKTASASTSRFDPQEHQ